MSSGINWTCGLLAELNLSAFHKRDMHYDMHYNVHHRLVDA